MLARLELRVRSALRAFLGKLGTTATAFTLLVLAGVALVASRIWAQMGSPEGAHAFATSFAFEAIAVALVVDAAVGLLRALPASVLTGRAFRLQRPDVRQVSCVAIHLGYALAALAFTASLLGRGAVVLRIAAGEEATGDVAQIVDREPLRSFSQEAYPVRFTVLDVAGTVDARVASDAAVGVRMPDGRVRRFSGRWPLWIGWTWLVWPESVGYALRYEIAVEKGAVLDSAIAKLDLSMEGERESIRSLAVPHRIMVELPASGSPGGNGFPPLDVSVYRGKLLVASGRLDPGGLLRFEGLVLRFPEAERWVELRVVHDPGLPLALIGGALAIAGAVLGRVSRRASSGSA